MNDTSNENMNQEDKDAQVKNCQNEPDVTNEGAMIQ